MKKLKIIVLAMFLLTSIHLLLSVNGSIGSLGYAEDCIKCYEDLGCGGGNANCAAFECKGTTVVCFTTLKI